jgi:hypothetical protein
MLIADIDIEEPSGTILQRIGAEWISRVGGETRINL